MTTGAIAQTKTGIILHEKPEVFLFFNNFFSLVVAVNKQVAVDYKYSNPWA